MKKKEFRKWAIERLRNISKQHSYLRDKKINKQLKKIIISQKASTVMIYIPLQMEVNVMPLIRDLRRRKIEVLVPFMEDKSFRLVKYRLPLYKKKYGIKEPKNSKQFRRKKIDISIVPIVGLDLSMRRIGFGKGMYDRFFAKNINSIDKIIFVQRALCLSTDILTEAHDVTGDELITIR